MEHKIIVDGKVFVFNDAAFNEIMSLIRVKANYTIPVGYSNTPSGLKYQQEHQDDGINEGKELLLG